MLIDVFSLLAEARQRIAATITAIEAKRDFWLATVDLKAAVAGGGRSGNSKPINASRKAVHRTSRAAPLVPWRIR
jgi:hypothetical protein